MLTPAAKADLVKLLGNEDRAAISVWLDEIERVEITTPDLYDQTARAETLLVKAAAHLAQLINTVRFKQYTFFGSSNGTTNSFLLPHH